jgi:hypothetical protein
MNKYFLAHKNIVQSLALLLCVSALSAPLQAARKTDGHKKQHREAPSRKFSRKSAGQGLTCGQRLEKVKGRFERVKDRLERLEERCGDESRTKQKLSLAKRLLIERLAGDGENAARSREEAQAQKTANTTLAELSAGE